MFASTPQSVPSNIHNLEIYKYKNTNTNTNTFTNTNTNTNTNTFTCLLLRPNQSQAIYTIWKAVTKYTNTLIQIHFRRKIKVKIYDQTWPNMIYHLSFYKVLSNRTDASFACVLRTSSKASTLKCVQRHRQNIELRKRHLHNVLKLHSKLWQKLVYSGKNVTRNSFYLNYTFYPIFHV